MDAHARGGSGRSSGFSSREAAGWARAWTEEVAAECDPPLSSRFVDTRFGRTHLLRSEGEAAAGEVLCFSGWGLPAAFWAYSGALGELARSHRISLVDVPGQPGLSDGRPLPYRAGPIAAWLEDLLEGLGVESVSLMGSSMGALLAVRAASRMPGRVRALVLCGPAGFALPLLRPAAMPALLRFRTNATRERCAAFIDACLLGHVQPVAAAVRAKVDEAFFRFSNGFRNRSVPSVHLRATELRAVQQETLLLVGDQDPLFSSARTRGRARKLLTGLADERVLAPHGHAFELSGEAVRAAAGFLSTRATGRASVRSG